MNACPSCGEVIDVSGCAPYSKVLCPSCNVAIRVRGDFLNFQIKKKIGEGGMSRVFRAVDQTLAREVALKILNPDFSKDAKRAEEFEREAKITAAISHPNVVKVYSAGKDQDHYFIAMELVAGGSLDETIVAEGALDEMRVLDFAAELVQGLNAALEAGLIHRDMKPGNVLFSQDGTSKIVDFGLAIMLDGSHEEEAEIWATPYYVPPEKLYKEPEDFRSDIYSLGATLFHALAGKPPYSADTSSIEELKAIKDKPISLELSAPRVSMPTCELVDRMMARQPDDRYSSYDELLEHVNFARQQLSEGGGETAATARLRTRRKVEESKARNLALTLLGVVVLVLGGIIGFQLWNRKDDVRTDSPSTAGNSGGTGGIVLDEGQKSTSERFENARQMLLSKKFGPAENSFQRIATSQGTQQPTANWALFNQGLAGLFRGRMEEATAAFATLSEKAEFSTEEKDRELVGFFKRASNSLASGLPVPTSEQSGYATDGAEAMGLLASGLKNWEMGSYAAAQSYFRAFRDAKPRDADWVKDFRKLLRPYLHDLDILAQFPTFRRDAGYSESLAALEKSKEIANQLTLPGVKKRLSKRVARLERSVARLEVAEQEAKIAEQAQLRAQEGRRMAALNLELDEHRSALALGKGVVALEEEPFLHPDYAQVYKDRLYVWKGAAKFVDMVISDLNLHGYNGPVEQVSGVVRAMNVVAADRERLTYQFGLAQGQSKIPLAQITDATLLLMADKLSQNYPDMSEYLPRREGRALFAYVVQDEQIALEASSEIKSEEFRALWERIEGRDGGS